MQGDKVLCTKNSMIRVLRVAGPKRRLCVDYVANGSQFIIAQDKEEPLMDVEIDKEVSKYFSRKRSLEKMRFLTLSDMCGGEISAVYEDLTNRAKMRQAWALTVHKFQGTFF